MPRATTTIPFHALRFEDDLPTLHEVERRLKTFLRALRKPRREGRGAAMKMGAARWINSSTTRLHPWSKTTQDAGQVRQAQIQAGNRIEIMIGRLRDWKSVTTRYDR